MQDLILREKEEAFTTSVIITQMYAKYPLNHRQIIITTEKLLDSVRYDGEHNDQISAFEGDILLNGVKNVPKDSKYGIGFSLKDSLSGAIFRKKTYSTKAGNTYIVWEYNRAAFMLITMQLSRYKKALLNQRLFIMGFDLMEERIRLTKVEEQYILKETLNIDPKGTISVVNSLPREEYVRGYYRSINGKRIAKLDKLIAKARANLGGLFGDDELVSTIDELVEERETLAKEEVERAYKKRNQGN